MEQPAQVRRVDDPIPDNIEDIEREIDYWTDEIASCARGSQRYDAIEGRLRRLERAKLRIPGAMATQTSGNHMRRNVGKNIFVGHGGSLVWLQLKEFLTDRLHRTCVEFNSEAVAGKTTTRRLEEMLDEAGFAFLVMTAEDIHADNSTHARENVIHEAGLFQGRLGFQRAIILLEDGCIQFSNIHGLTHIPFPKGNLKPAFEQIREVLEREERSTGSKEVFNAERCPKCARTGWSVESSKPDRQFGDLGINLRTYKCRFCGFSEGKLAT